MATLQSSTPFGVIVLLWGAGLGAAAQYAKISVIFDLLPTVYPTAGPTLGFVVSVVGFVGILFGVVAGLMVSRVGYRRALIWALFAGAGLSALQATLPSLWVMLMLRMLEGASHLAIVVAAPTLIAQLSAPQHRGFTLTLWGTFFGVAFALLVWLGRPLVAGQGIGALFLAHAGWMAIFAVILLIVLPKTERSQDTSSVTLGQVVDNHIRLYRSPFMAAPGIGWLFYTFCFLSLLTLLPPYIAPQERAFVLAAMPLISIIVSMSAGVIMLRFMTAVQVIIAGFVLTLTALIWLLLDVGDAAACIALAAALGLVQGASFAAVPQLNDTADRQALANGAMAQMGNIGNSLGTPVLAIVVLGTGYSGMIWSAFVVITLGIVAHLWLARRRIYLNV